MIALARVLRHLHLAQQRVHLSDGQIAMRTYRCMARHRCEQIVLVLAHAIGRAVDAKIRKHVGDETPRRRIPNSAGTPRTMRLVGPLRSISRPSDSSHPGAAQPVPPRRDSRSIAHRHEQTLLLDPIGLRARSFHLFVRDALMRGMHVDDDEAIGVLRKDVDPVQLPNGITKGRNIDLRSAPRIGTARRWSRTGRSRTRRLESASDQLLQRRRTE